MTVIQPKPQTRVAVARPVPAASGEVLSRLSEMCELRGLGELSAELLVLRDLAGPDLERLVAELGTVDVSQRLAQRAAGALLSNGGKRLRPLCVALAARVGNGFDDAALQLAVAVELVHNATLLHDDVIDLAPTRRGAPAARAEFGNAASIFAGDWLLIEALRRVRRAGVPGLLDELLETIAEMIRGESLQLENRGRLAVDRELYFEIAESKSATLFRWALRAGARAGGLGSAECRALGDYGTQLGVAFQIIDDLLDFTGERQATGKELFADLREGKLTLPLILALEQEPDLRPTLEEIASSPEASVGSGIRRRIAEVLVRTGAVRDSRELAGRRIAAALECLERVPAGNASAALALVARSTLMRDG